ncbi:hypothetical protein Tco_0507518 [Tanacetum coccineum]
MASHRSKSLYAIKECSTCGSLYTKDCCSIGNLNDKILVSESDSSPCCARCGTPVDGPSCRGCAFLRKKFDEDLLAYCVENGIFKDFQNTSESSDNNTNVVNALREPCVVNQDPGEKSSQEPPQIDHNCCYECGDSLDGIFCRQCICKSCGKGAHYGYNCPPKVPIISNPEQCNQTINKPPQILPNVHPKCNYEDENPFISDFKPHSFNVSPSVLTYPPQLQFETYLCELCGNNAHYGYDCPGSPSFFVEAYLGMSIKASGNGIDALGTGVKQEQHWALRIWIYGDEFEQRSWTSSVLPLLAGGIVSFVTSVVTRKSSRTGSRSVVSSKQILKACQFKFAFGIVVLDLVCMFLKHCIIGCDISFKICFAHGVSEEQDSDRRKTREVEFGLRTIGGHDKPELAWLKLAAAAWGHIPLDIVLVHVAVNRGRLRTGGSGPEYGLETSALAQNGNIKKEILH